MEPNQSTQSSPKGWPSSLEGWPRSLEGDLVWSGTGSSPADPHMVQLLEADVRSIEDALAKFKEKGEHGDKVCRADFELPDDLARRLRDAAGVVHNKQGSCIIRGLDPAKYSAADNAMIYLGIASYIGDILGVQDSNGNMLGHITVAKQWESVPDNLRHGAHTNKALPFHNDMGTSVLGLHYRELSAEGGLTHLSSASTLYNELAKDYRDVLETLAAPDWPIQITDRKASFTLDPLLQYYKGRLFLSLDPGRLGPQIANPEHMQYKNHFTTKPKAENKEKPSAVVPALTHKQKHALDTLAELAKKHKVKVPAERGDMLFFNNWALLHARDEYKDAPDAGEEGGRRHLVRVWLHDTELAWEMPPSQKTPWAAAYGYHFKDAVDPKALHARNRVNRQFSVDPESNYPKSKYTAGSAAFFVNSSDDEDGDN